MAAKGGLVFTLRKHRKKSIFAAGVICYGFHYATKKYREYLIRREYFTEAKKYGEKFISPLDKPRRLYVIINPTASNGNCRELFKKNAAPILNLAGIDLTVIQTDYEGHAKTTVNYFDSNYDGVVVAGGDGSMHEVVTGIYRQRDDDSIHSMSVGFIPLGTHSNSIYRKFFSTDVYQVRSICKATMAVVKGFSKKTSVMEIETGEKSIYALSNIHFGAHQQVKEKVDAGKYWLLGPLKQKFAFMWRTARNWPPQFGIHVACSPLTSGGDGRDDELNPEINTENFSLYLHEDLSDEKEPSLRIQKIKNDQSRQEFVNFGWEWLKNKFNFTPNDEMETMTCSEVSIVPPDETLSYDIDGEIFDARPIKVRVHPRKLNIYCNADLAE